MDASHPMSEQPPTPRALADVISEAVAVAEEAGAIEAADERASDVAVAARVVADAAEADHEARESAAAATALVLAGVAERTASQVQAQADTTAATAEETQRAARLVAIAVVAAASTVADARGVDEHRIQNDVTAARWTLEQKVAMTASQVTRRRTAHAERVTSAVLARVAGLTDAPRGADEPVKD